MEKSVPLAGKFDITFQVQLPNEWDPSLGIFNVGVTAGVETDRCPIDWATTHREKMNLVIVPSFHARSGMVLSGTGREKTPVLIVPEAYFPEILQEPTRDPLADLPTSKNFLIVGTLISDDPLADRKNLVSSIKWFLEAFRGDESVGLIVKTSKGRDTTIDREMIRKLLKKIKKKFGDKSSAKIFMLHGSMTREEMTNLYKSPKLVALLSATRGEGFGLPMVEAAVAGLPVVATNWSAHTEFLKGDSFLGVNYDLAQIPDSRVDGKIFVAGSKWAEVREGNFKKKMLLAVKESDSLRNSASKLSGDLQTTHSLKSVFKYYKTAISAATEG